MRKEVFIDDRAQTELHEFSHEVQHDFKALITILQEDGKLEFPDARKVSKDLFEMRVMQRGVYRGFYAYIWKDHITVLHFFQKKEQKTPLQHIKLAHKRFNDYV